MLIYDNIYTWEGPDYSDHVLWLISCHLRIIDLSLSHPSLTFLKSKIVVAADVNEGPKRKICAETLGRQIYKEFNLDMKRTLWAEYDPFLPSRIMAAQMKPKYHDGSEIIYTIQWRKLMETERDLIKRFIPSLDI
jgi:hypothetical protein